MQEYLARYRVDVYAFRERRVEDRDPNKIYPFDLLDFNNDSPEHRFRAENDKGALHEANRFMRTYKKEYSNDSIGLVELLRIKKIR